MLWFPIDVEPKLEVIAIEHLSMSHPAVVAAARILPRKLKGISSKTRGELPSSPVWRVMK